MLNNSEIKKKVRHRFFVTPKQGVNFSGVLIKRTNKDSVFADVKAHLPNTEPEPLAGEMYIDNQNVAYMQLMPIDDRPNVTNVTYLTRVGDSADD